MTTGLPEQNYSKEAQKENYIVDSLLMVSGFLKAAPDALIQNIFRESQPLSGYFLPPSHFHHQVQSAAEWLVRFLDIFLRQNGYKQSFQIDLSNNVLASSDCYRLAKCHSHYLGLQDNLSHVFSKRFERLMCLFQTQIPAYGRRRPQNLCLYISHTIL